MGREADLSPLDLIESSWGNAVRDTGVIWFTDASERTAQWPSPHEGALSYLQDTNAYESYNGSAWVALPGGSPTGAAGGDLSGTYPNPTVVDANIDHGSIGGLADNDHPQYALAANAVMDGDTAGGDLAGTYPNPTVQDDSHAHTASTLPATIVYDGDTAGGVLGGTYPNPSFADSSITDLQTAWTPASASGPSSLDFFEDTDNGTNRVRVTVPASVSDRTHTIPDVASDTFVMEAAAQTLTNKTLTAPTLADFTNANHDHLDADDGGTLTPPAIAGITTDRLLGRDTAGTGAAEQISVGGGVEFTGGPGIQRSALTGDVTASAGNNATTIANDAVSNAKMADMAQATIKGRASGAGTGDPTDLTAAQVVAITNSLIDHGTLTGLTDDDHSQYANGGAQRAAAQTFEWASGSGVNTIYRTTSHATKGEHVFTGAGNFGTFAEVLATATSSVGFDASGAFSSAIAGVHASNFISSTGSHYERIGAANTTNATVTTADTIPIPTDCVMWVECLIIARRDDETQSAKYRRTILVRNDSGAITTDQAVTAVGTDFEATGGWDATLDVSGTDVRVRVTGAAATNLEWISFADVYQNLEI